MKKVIVLILIALAGYAIATVPSETTSVSYTCSGTSYAYSFKVISQTDFQVLVYDPSTAVTTTLSYGNQYTMTGLGSATGGTVTLASSSLCPTNATLTLKRRVDYTQKTSFRTQGNFSPATHENAFDKAMMGLQQLNKDYSDLGSKHNSDMSSLATQRFNDLSIQALRDAGQDVALVTPPETPATAGDGRIAFLRLLWTLKTQGGKKVTWVGDSITEQGKTVGQGFTNVIQAAYPGITYSNQGIGGQTTVDVIGRLATITATNADLYVLAIGVNDARYNDGRGATTVSAYITNITTIVNALKVGGKSVVVLSIWPTFDKDQYAALGREKTDARFIQWNQALENACKTTLNVPFVDAASVIRRVVDYSNVTTLIPDGVHPDWDGAAYVGTIGAQLYAAAVLRSSVPKGEFATAYVPTGTVFYRLKIFDHDAAGGDYVSIQNISPSPSPVTSEYFAYSANPAVNPANLIGAYNAGAAGFLNKVGDWPATITWAEPGFATTIITAWRGGGLGIKSYELSLSTNPEALANPTHSSWVVKERETSNAAFAHNLIPKQRTGVFYRFQIDTSDGVDGTGGNTGTYVKVTKLWGGTPPVRWSHLNLAESSNLRTDLVFSEGGGNATLSLNNNANAYPLHLMWESETELAQLTFTSVQGAGRAIKNWKLFISRDPASLTSASHSTWRQIAAGVYDQTVDLVNGGMEPLGVNSTTPSVTGGKTFYTANIAPTTITQFTGATNGQRIVVLVKDANTTFDFLLGSGKLRGGNGYVWAAPQNSSIDCTYHATDDRWYCRTSSSGTVPPQNMAGSAFSIGSCSIKTGAASPEGAITGNPCDIFLRTDPEAAGTTLYVKQSGSATNTGWVGK